MSITKLIQRDTFAPSRLVIVLVIVTMLVIIALSSMIPIAHAQRTGGIDIGTTDALLNRMCDVFRFMLNVLFILSVIMFLVGGYLYVTAGGGAENVSKATKTLVYAAVGIVVALVAASLPLLVGSILNVSPGVIDSCLVF